MPLNIRLWNLDGRLFRRFAISLISLLGFFRVCIKAKFERQTERVAPFVVINQDMAANAEECRWAVKLIVLDCLPQKIRFGWREPNVGQRGH